MTCIRAGSRPRMLSSFTGTLVNMPGCVFSPSASFLINGLLQLASNIKEDSKSCAAVEEPRKRSMSEALEPIESLNHTRCPSSGKFRNIDVATQPSNVRIDLACHSSHLFDDKKNNRTHPEHRCLQDPGRDHCKCFGLRRDGHTIRFRGETILKLLTRRPIVE